MTKITKDLAQVKNRTRGALGMNVALVRAIHKESIMKKALILVIAMVLSGALLVNCSSDKDGNPAPPPETHDTESTGEDTGAESVEATEEGEDEEAKEEETKERLVNLQPNTGLDVSYIEGDFNIVDRQRVIVLDYGVNITRMITENRYFYQDGNNTRNVGCDVFYYAHDSKSIEQLAAEHNVSVREAILQIAAGVAGNTFGGSYNPDGKWYFQGSFVNNVERCTQSIAGSGLINSVRKGDAEVVYVQESLSVLEELNNREL